MRPVSEALQAYLQTHPFNSGTSGCETVLEQLYQAYCESHESDPPEITVLFRQLSDQLEQLPIETNNSMFALICDLCITYEHKAFLDGVQYGARLMMELHEKENYQ